jgi:hypothetical protein
LDAERTMLRLMADYDCYPLWVAADEGVMNVDPADLGVSDELVASLEDWRCWYDSTLDRNDPVASGFSSRDKENEFVEQGRQLAAKLAVELRSRYVVAYQIKGSKHLENFENCASFAFIFEPSDWHRDGSEAHSLTTAAQVDRVGARRLYDRRPQNNALAVSG